MLAVICDEDKQVTERVREHLLDISRKRGVSLEVQDYHSADSLFFHMEDEIRDVDLMLLEMKYADDMNGVDIAMKLRIMGYEGEIIFETYDKEQVFDSFDANPFHYIVKGETQETKIEDILERAIIKLEGGRREIISLTCAGERRNIPIADLLYFEVDHRIIRAHYGRNETFEFYSTIGKLENLLLGKGFERAHRAFLVSLPHVAGFGGSEISMDNGDIIPLGRTYAKAFRQALDKGAGE